MKPNFIRRKPGVQAIQFTGKNYFDVQTFINGRQPDLKSDYAKEKWEEYCQKCDREGCMQIPSSLGYDPTYSMAEPGSYIVSDAPGVYSVMGQQTFEEQYMPMPTSEEIRDVSGVNALAEGYGPLKIELPYPDALINSAVANLQAGLAPEFEPGELVKRRAAVKAFLPQADFDNLLKDLTIETERAIKQHARWVATGKSTASHGGSHDTCFGFILAKYIATTQRLLKVPEGEIPSEIIEGAAQRESGKHELTVDMFDHIKAVLVKYITGQYVLTEAEARAMATHRHYKGGLYYKLFDALHTETQEQMTIYLHLFPHEPGAYARPKLMFESPNEAGQTRFERLR
jgi:hypothetical protein